MGLGEEGSENEISPDGEDQLKKSEYKELFEVPISIIDWQRSEESILSAAMIVGSAVMVISSS